MGKINPKIVFATLITNFAFGLGDNVQFIEAFP